MQIADLKSMLKERNNKIKIGAAILLLALIITVFAVGHFEIETSTYRVFGGRISYYWTLPF